MQGLFIGKFQRESNSSVPRLVAAHMYHVYIVFDGLTCKKRAEMRKIFPSPELSMQAMSKMSACIICQISIEKGIYLSYYYCQFLVYCLLIFEIHSVSSKNRTRSHKVSAFNENKYDS